MTPTLPPYPAYKPSGIPWLGDVPAHWEVRRLKTVAQLIMGQSPASENCRSDEIGRPFLQGCAEFGIDYPSPVQYCHSPSKVSPIGSILMSVRAPVGRLNISDQIYGIGRGLCAIVPNNQILLPKFVLYELQVTRDGFALVSTGSTYEAVSIGDVGTHPAIIPPLAEQKAIVRYLDYTDARIRRVIRAREKQLALLAEYKQALIEQAVTGKIDVRTGGTGEQFRSTGDRQVAPTKYPAYKPSGIPWLGDVPSHWEVRRLRSIIQMLVSNVDKHSKDDEIPVRLCNYVDVYKNDHITENIKFMRATASADEIEKFRLISDDVIITKDSESWDDIGVPALVKYTAQDLVCGYHLAILRPRSSILKGSYLFRALQVPGIATQFHVSANGVTRYGLSHSAIKIIMLPLPPLAEQKAIVRFLDAQTAKIERAAAAIRREIDLLKEYRTRLIADVVTGKVDIRTAAETLNFTTEKQRPRENIV